MTEVVTEMSSVWGNRFECGVSCITGPNSLPPLSIQVPLLSDSAVPPNEKGGVYFSVP